MYVIIDEISITKTKGIISGLNTDYDMMVAYDFTDEQAQIPYVSFEFNLKSERERVYFYKLLFNNRTSNGQMPRTLDEAKKALIGKCKNLSNVYLASK